MIANRRARLGWLLGLTLAVTALAGCPQEQESPTPTVTGLSPGLVCNDQLTTTVVVNGSAMSPVVRDVLTDDPGLFLPDLRLYRSLELTGDDAADTSIVNIDEESGRVSWTRQSEMAFEVSPDMSLDPGVYDISVTNMDGQTARLGDALAVVPPPRVDAIVPDLICAEQFANGLTLEGEWFLVVEGELPTVSVDGQTFPVDDRDGCFDLAGPVSAESCTSIHITIPAGGLAVGTYQVEVTNPAPAGCASTETITLEVVPPPTVESVEPTTICSTGGEFSVFGSDFYDGAEVLVGETPADSVDFVDEGQLDAFFAGGVSAGIYDVTVINADGCSDTLDNAVEVVQGPILFFVDPEVVYSGITTQVSLLVAGITGDIVDVWIQLDDDEEVHLDFTYDPSDPNVILAIVPEGLPDGDYDVFVQEDTLCTPFLENALTVESDLTVAIDEVAPRFGWTEESTAIDIRATDPAPDGMVQFEEIPSVYLNPAVPDAETVATRLRSVTFQGPRLLNAVVPAGLEIDDYDVIVVNPSGAIGLLTDAFSVTELEPPVITSVSPGRVDHQTDESITAVGENFRSGELSLTCRAPGGAISDVAVSGSTGTATEVTGTVPSSTLAEGTVCVVRVTNSDGSYFDFSAISIGSPSGNLFQDGFQPGPDLSTARRAPAAAAGRATATSRYLYVMGGDSGTASGALDSIERAPVDVFGDLGAFQTLPGELPDPLTLAAVVQLDRFIYLVGGNKGSGAVDDIIRAQVLDPLASPEFDTLAIAIEEDSGLGGGVWVYRVSAIFAEDDPINPDGESLASDPIVIRLPEIEEMGIELTLAWTSVPRAVGYRIYRTPAADAGSNAERFLAEVTGGGTTQFTDTGLTTEDTRRPLPPGALGEWTEVTTLSTAREGACAAIGRDPGTAGRHVLYVGGGRDDGGDILASIERFQIDPDGTIVGNQTVGSSTASGTLDEARWQCGGFVVDDRLHSLPAAGETWIFFGPGRIDTGVTGTIEGGRVTAGGALTNFVPVDQPPSPGLAGYGTAAASDFLYMFGGRQGNPGNQGVEGEIFTLPNDIDFDSLGGSSIDTARILMGSAQESAVIFIVGGEGSGGSILSSTEVAPY